MSNPFNPTAPPGQLFCNRSREVADLKRSMENGQKVLVFGERRLGKTSVVLKAMEQLDLQHFIPLYIDLWKTHDSISFANTFMDVLLTHGKSQTNKFFDLIKGLAGKARLSFSFDEEGKPGARFDFSGGKAKSADIETALRFTELVAKRSRKKPVIIFDEFQRIFEYPDDLVERTLRSVIQHQNFSFIFLGSSKHILEAVCLNSRSPFYRGTVPYPVGMIGEEHWLPYLAKEFKKGDRVLEKDGFNEIMSMTNGHPYYVERVCQVLWDEEILKIQKKDVLSCMKLVLEKETPLFLLLWEGLSMLEKRFLGLLCQSEMNRIYSKDFLKVMGAPTSIKRVLKSLSTKDIVTRDYEGIRIGDRFFRIWLLQRFT